MEETPPRRTRTRCTRIDCWARWSALAAICALLSGGCAREAALPAQEHEPQPDERQSSTLAARAPVQNVKWSGSAWKPQAPERDWAYVVIHHTATESGSVESIHRAHRAKRDAAGNPWRGVGYHFVIGNGKGMDDGAVEPTFRWKQQLSGAHAGVGDYNEQGIGVCLIGNFEEHPPTPRQLESLKQLIGELAGAYDIPPSRIVGHNDVNATKCPGRFFPMEEFAPPQPTESGARGNQSRER